MIKRSSILFFFSIFCVIVSHAQFQPAEITRVTIDPVTQITTVYFTGTDHPDVNFYYVMKMLNEADGEAIMSSYTTHDGSPAYQVVLDIPEVTQGPVGLYIRPHQDADTPLTSVTSSLKDSTIYLSVEYDWCLNTAYLEWNDYNRWSSQSPQYQVMREVNGNLEVLTEVSKGVNEFTVRDIQAQNNYLFYIHARRSLLDPADYVLSNGVNLDTLATVYPEYIHADYGTVGSSNNPELRFSIDPDSDLETYALLRSTHSTGPYDTIEYINSTDMQISYSDTEVDASTRPYYYKIAALNFCDQTIGESENIAGTIYLEGQLTGTSVDINWTSYQEWPQGVSGYVVERIFEGENPEPVTNVNGLSASDDLSSFNNDGHSSLVCYRVTATENPGDPHSPELASSQSNIYCVNIPMNIDFTFSAFTPEGMNNNDFGPYMEFLPSYYNFKIFNRSGTRVFQSDDPDNKPRWDGRLRNGSFAPEGVYRYILLYEDENSNRSSLQGNVTLVRP